MFKSKSKSFLSLLFLAALSFSVISVGGEFLHSKIHHHATQASHDECPVFQLLAQAVITVTAMAVVVVFKPVFDIPAFQPAVVVSSHSHRPYLRAPPSLS